MEDVLYQPFPMLSGRRAQVWRHQPAYRRPRHFHVEPELNIVFSGWALMGVGRHQLLLQKGDVLFLKPAQDHVMLECSDDLELIVLAAVPELAARFSLDMIRAATRAVHIPHAECNRVQDVLFNLSGVSSALPQEETVGSLFEWALSQSQQGSSVSRRALSAIYRNEQQSAVDLARELKVPVSELSRHFSNDLGFRFVDARARLRLIRFIESVDRGQTLTRAASDHFGSYAQCHRVFRKHLGCSPKEFFLGARSEIAQATARNFGSRE